MAVSVTNVLGYYNPYFYANEALIALENSLGLAARVHRGFDAERSSFKKGEYVNIRKPSTYTAASAPVTHANAQNTATESVQIRLNQWKEVKFAITDAELAYSGEQIINDHIRPAAYALADNIDNALADLYIYVGNYYNCAAAASEALTDITGPRKVLFDLGVPIGDAENMHYMIGSTMEAGFLGLSAFAQHQGAGDVGVETQLKGTLGYKFGVEIFANQNVNSHTSGACADTAGAIAGDEVAGATDITIDDLTDTHTVKAGDMFTIAGDTTKYAFTADGTVASNALTDIGISPALKADAAEDAVVTIVATDHTANMMFHKNAFALAMAPLPSMANELGAKVATVTDPKSGVSVRSRLYYDGEDSAVYVALDVLYGVKCLDPQFACRGFVD